MVRLITFEGGDGSGKTTQMKRLEGYLTSKGKTCLLTHEPGGTELGKWIRKVIVEGGRGEVANEMELFLYLADRAQHIHEVIRPAMEKGKIVLCDRFTDSTLAYQGYGRGFNLELLQRMNQLASGGLQPDLTLLLDCAPETALSRARRRTEEQSPGVGRGDRFESQNLDFHERVRGGFLDIARAEPNRVVVLDSSAPAEEVHEQIKKIVDERLAELEKR
jgi:dTMP kinase